MKDDEDKQLRLSALRALWGNVTPPMRSASVEYEGQIIHWQCIYDNSATDEDMELASDAAGELISDYSEEYELKETIVIIPNATKMTHLKNLIYLRKENH